MRKVLGVVLLAAVVMAGCKEPEPPPPPPAPPPPPPTAQQLYDENMPAVRLMLLPKMASNRKAITNALNQLKNKLSPSAQVNGPTALLRIGNDLKTRLKAAHDTAPDSGQWDTVSVLCYAVLALDPGDSGAARYLKQSEAERMRPQISLTRVLEDLETNVVNVYLEVHLPKTNTTESLRVRVGDEFHGVRLDRIIGRNSAIEITYLETDRTYRIETK